MTLTNVVIVITVKSNLNDGIEIDSVFVKYKKKPNKGTDGFINDLEGIATKNWNNTNEISWYYQRWRCMRTRARHSKDTTVSEEWKTLSNFINDLSGFDNALKAGYHLDKDLLSTNNVKHYSKDTCLIIPASLNRALGLTTLGKDEKKILLKRYKQFYKNVLNNKASTALQEYINKL